MRGHAACLLRQPGGNPHAPAKSQACSLRRLHVIMRLALQLDLAARRCALRECPWGAAPKIRSWPGQHPGLHLGRLKASLGEGVKARYENLARAPCGAPRISHKSHGVAAGADAALAAPSRSLRSPSRSSAALPSVGKRRRDADGRRTHRSHRRAQCWPAATGSRCWRGSSQLGALSWPRRDGPARTGHAAVRLCASQLRGAAAWGGCSLGGSAALSPKPRCCPTDCAVLLTHSASIWRRLAGRRRCWEGG